MAYTDQNKFQIDYGKREGKLIAPGPVAPPFWDFHVSADAAYHLYANTFALKGMGVYLDGQPSQFFGRLVGDWEKLLNAGIIKLGDLPDGLLAGIGSQEKKNLLTLDNYIDQGGKWTPLINDCWLLAGVNSLQRFYACSKITWDNILDNKYIVTATGRELVGLALAGYNEVQSPNIKGKVYHIVEGLAGGPADQKARDLSLLDYDEQIRRLTNKDEVRDFFTTGARAGAFYIDD